MNNPDLIARACQGDASAWETLVRQHQQAVFRLAYLMLGDGDEAEDVAQEVFIRAFHALTRFDATRPLRPWLLRITTNLVNNRRRSVGRYLAAVRRWFHAASDDNLAVVEERSQQQWESETLWQAIRRLSQVDQEVIYLRYFLELSVAETGEVLGVAAGTVKSRLARATGRLQAVIAREFPALQEARES
jgi:RNA polymerase sigma-70 factor (ECF subfamily)